MNEKVEDNNQDYNQEKYVELNVFIKKIGLAATGGQAKVIIRSGNVILNGTPETRNKKKLFDKDVVEIEGRKYTVKVE